MKTKTKNFAILLILGLVFPLLLNFNLNITSGDNINSIKPKSSGGYIETFIHIDGSIPNNWSDTASTYDWCSGDGSWNNPYIIEDVTIDGTGREFGIFITNSKNDYFIIRNCTVYNVGLTPNDGAILLVNVSIGNIINNNCSFNVGCGITLDTNCNNNTISGNTANDNQPNTVGINLNLSDNNTISGNTANGNGNSGIYIGDSDYNTLLGNTLEGNDYGVWMNGGDNNNITGNVANGNVIGLGYEYGENNTFSGNTVNNNTYSGMYLTSNIINNTLTGNTVNNNTLYGIYLDDCDSNTVSGNTLDGNEIGIFIYVGLNNTIIGNTISNNIVSGIHIDEDSDYNEFTENIIRNNTIGLNINSLNDNNLVYKNFFLNNGKHASDSGTSNKWNNTVIGNYWDNHTGPDDSPQDGIVDDWYTYIGGSAGSMDYLPIAEDGAPSITINSPSDDDVFGSDVPNYDVTITDDYLSEMWYTFDGGLHNYTFTEFTGTIEQSSWDSVSDGPVILTFYASDIPGNIGFAEVSIEKDTTGPLIIITSPSSGAEIGASAPAFIITITDDHLDSMWYSLDEGLTTYAITTNATIDQAAWAALSEGSITITFYANDTLGNLSFEEILITKSIPSGGIDPTITIVIFVVSIVGGVAIFAGIYIFMKKRATPE